MSKHCKQNFKNVPAVVENDGTICLQINDDSGWNWCFICLQINDDTVT